MDNSFGLKSVVRDPLRRISTPCLSVKSYSPTSDSSLSLFYSDSRAKGRKVRPSTSHGVRRKKKKILKKSPKKKSLKKKKKKPKKFKKRKFVKTSPQPNIHLTRSPFSSPKSPQKKKKTQSFLHSYHQLLQKIKSHRFIVFDPSLSMTLSSLIDTFQSEFPKLVSHRGNLQSYFSRTISFHVAVLCSSIKFFDGRAGSKTIHPEPINHTIQIFHDFFLKNFLTFKTLNEIKGVRQLLLRTGISSSSSPRRPGNSFGGGSRRRRSSVRREECLYLLFEVIIDVVCKRCMFVWNKCVHQSIGKLLYFLIMKWDGSFIIYGQTRILMFRTMISLLPFKNKKLYLQRMLTRMCNRKESFRSLEFIEQSHIWGLYLSSNSIRISRLWNPVLGNPELIGTLRERLWSEKRRDLFRIIEILLGLLEEVKNGVKERVYKNYFVHVVKKCRPGIKRLILKYLMTCENEKEVFWKLKKFLNISILKCRLKFGHQLFEKRCYFTDVVVVCVDS